MAIVVGVDGSDGSRRALRWALAEARLRKTNVEAVLVWSFLDQHDAHGRSGFRPDYLEANAKTALQTVIAEEGRTFPDVEIASRTVVDLPARGLLEAAKTAELLVVGARGLGGFAGLLLGSVSQQAVLHAGCPVVVVHH